jgi:hypothetical protein
MTAPEFFRFLIIARIALAVVFRVTGWVPWDHHRLSDSMNPFMALLIELPLIAAAIAITVGLWQFRWWARIGYVAAAGFYAGVAIFFPPHTPFEYSPAVAAFAYFQVASQAALITMAFLPPIADRFEHSKA